VPILPKERDPRLITIRRGGALTDEHHRLLADWALLCAEHVLHLFEDHRPGDGRPRDALDVGRAWIRGEVRMGAHTGRPSRRTPRRAERLIQRSSLRCRRVRRLRWLTLPLMTWALRRTPSGRPAQASPSTTRPELGPRNGSGSGRTSRPLSVISFSTINNAGAPSAGTSSTTDLQPATRPLLPRPPPRGCGPSAGALVVSHADGRAGRRWGPPNQCGARVSNSAASPGRRRRSAGRVRGGVCR
jgi:hypothetical protein